MKKFYNTLFILFMLTICSCRGTGVSEVSNGVKSIVRTCTEVSKTCTKNETNENDQNSNDGAFGIVLPIYSWDAKGMIW